MAADRVSITLGQTIQIRRFEPVKMDVHYESDVLPGETVKDALARVEDVVDEKLAAMLKELPSDE